jgi:hypothetical protein
LELIQITLDHFMSEHKKIAVIQSNYIPWKGYFDIINYVDEFILFDVAQYTKNDWRNRNKIKTKNGLIWLTIPIKRSFGQKIHEAQVADQRWRAKHWRSISENYSKRPNFDIYKEQFKQLYLDHEEIYLSKINFRFLTSICEILNIQTKISWASDYKISSGKTDRLISLTEQTGAKEYISGPSAKSYLDENMFKESGIKLSYMDYSGYPEYNQQHPPFNHYVSIIDLLFNEGPNTHKFMKSFSNL